MPPVLQRLVESQIGASCLCSACCTCGYFASLMFAITSASCACCSPQSNVVIQLWSICMLQPWRIFFSKNRTFDYLRKISKLSVVSVDKLPSTGHRMILLVVMINIFHWQKAIFLQVVPACSKSLPTAGLRVSGLGVRV